MDSCMAPLAPLAGVTTDRRESYAGEAVASMAGRCGSAPRRHGKHDRMWRPRGAACGAAGGGVAACERRTTGRLDNPRVWWEATADVLHGTSQGHGRRICDAGRLHVASGRIPQGGYVCNAGTFLPV